MRKAPIQPVDPHRSSSSTQANIAPHRGSDVYMSAAKGAETCAQNITTQSAAKCGCSHPSHVCLHAASLQGKQQYGAHCSWTQGHYLKLL